jgi:Tfp pilus assembly protein PilV
VKARAGFSLVETVVAAVLLSIAVLSVAAGGAAALRAIASAEREHGALIAATAAIDSLAMRAAAGSGRILRPPFIIDWTATDSASLTYVRVIARSAAPPHDSILALELISARPPRVRF